MPQKPTLSSQGALTHLLTHLRARVRDEALERDSLSRSREGGLAEALHEWVDDSHGNLMSLLHFIQDLQGRIAGRTCKALMQPSYSHIILGPSANWLSCPPSQRLVSC